MRRGQVAKCGGGRYLKLRIQLLEAAGRQLGAACGELQQPGHLRLAKVADAGPKPGQNPPELRRVAIGDVV